MIQVNDTTIDITAHNPSLRIYNCTVDVIRLTKVNTALGIEESEVVIVSNLSAHIKWKSGTEKLTYDKVTHYLDATLRCRKPSGVAITTKDRVRFAGKDYEILDAADVNNLGKLLVMSLRKIE